MMLKMTNMTGKRTRDTTSTISARLRRFVPTAAAAAGSVVVDPPLYTNPIVSRTELPGCSNRTELEVIDCGLDLGASVSPQASDASVSWVSASISAWKASCTSLKTANRTEPGTD